MDKVQFHSSYWSSEREVHSRKNVQLADIYVPYINHKNIIFIWFPLKRCWNKIMHLADYDSKPSMIKWKKKLIFSFHGVYREIWGHRLFDLFVVCKSTNDCLRNVQYADLKPQLVLSLIAYANVPRGQRQFTANSCITVWSDWKGNVNNA